MAVELRRLIKKVKDKDISLVAGKEGLSNIVSWVHMIETKEASSFLQGGEIAFSTGIGLNNSLSILDLVQNIYDKGASGVVFNIGPFLEKIPSDVIEFGNAHNFPIFSLPWKIYMAEIMRIFSYTITKSEQEHLQSAAAFKNAILFPKQQELYVVPLSQLGFTTNWHYYVSVIHVLSSKQTNLPQKDLESLCLKIDTHLQHRKYKSFAIFSSDNLLICITGNYSSEMMESFANEMHKYLSTYLPADNHFNISIGKCTKSVRCLYKSYNQALSILKFQQSDNQAHPNLLSYSNMGIYKLLLGIEDKDILSEYYEKTIQPLVLYDEKNNSDFAEVLWTYLSHNGSVQETAEELFVHRNTINYKLNRAAEILNLNLSSLDTRVQLTLGFLLRNML